MIQHCNFYYTPKQFPSLFVCLQNSITQLIKIEAQNIEELFKASEDKEALMRELDKIITSNAPEMEGQLYASNSITMIGYGILPYHTKSYSSWPVIALTPQKTL